MGKTQSGDASLQQQLHQAHKRLTDLEKKLEALNAELNTSKTNLARFQVLFETFPQGITIADNSGQIVESNRKAEELLGLAREDHNQRRIDASAWCIIRPDGTPMPAEEYASVRSLQTGAPVDNIEMGVTKPGEEITWINVSAAPIPVQGGGLAITYDDITERKHREAELQKLNRTLMALSESTQSLMRATDEEQFLQDICAIVVQDCGYSLVWIGYAEEDEARTVRPVAFAGFDEGYLEQLDITWTEGERGKGPTGTAIRTGKPQCCRDMRKDPLFQPWRDEALKHGYASSLALPLMDAHQAFGAITFYAREVDAFSDDEVRLLGTLADDLAQGITALRWRIAHQLSEQALKESQQRYYSLFDAMTEGFALHEILCDEAGVPCDYLFLDINPAFERLTGLRRAEILGRRMREVLPEEDFLWLEKYGRVALTGEPVHFEIFSPVLNRHCEVHAYRPAPGQFAVVFQDITKRKESEAELERYRAHLEEIVKERTAELLLRNRQLEEEMAERQRAEQEKRAIESQLVHSQKMEALGRFAGGIAHDLNNILHPVIMETEMLLEETPPEASSYTTLQQILKAACRQRDLVKQILTFSRRSEPQVKPINVGPLIQETLQFLRATLPSTIAIRPQLEAKNDTIMGDATQIHQIVMNLCRNAADALEGQTGSIEVRLKNERIDDGSGPLEIKPGEYAVLCVEDNGCGMTPDVMEKIFEPFFTTKTVGKGIGMGLSVVHGILKNHGGSIQVMSEPGQGSRFSVYFPLLPKGALAPGIEAAQPQARAPKGRVLVVDDEDIILNSIERALKRSGYTVVAMNDSRQAVDVFSRTPDDFDLIITDLTMPHMTGMELSSKITAIRSGIPIILCTGYSDSINEHEAKAAGVRELLQKPASINDLRNAIHLALDQ